LAQLDISIFFKLEEVAKEYLIPFKGGGDNFFLTAGGGLE